MANLYINAEFAAVNGVEVYVDGNVVVEGGDVNLQRSDWTIGGTLSFQEATVNMTEASIDVGTFVAANYLTTFTNLSGASIDCIRLYLTGSKTNSINLPAWSEWGLRAQNIATVSYVNVAYVNSVGGKTIGAHYSNVTGFALNWVFNPPLTKFEACPVLPAFDFCCQLDNQYSTTNSQRYLGSNGTSAIVPAITICQQNNVMPLELADFAD